MKKIEKWKTWIFIGSLSFLALLIHSSQSPRQFGSSTARTYTPPAQQEFAPETPRPVLSQNKAATPREKTPEELAAERERFVARYVTGGAYRSAGSKAIGIVASENGKMNPSFATFLASQINSPNVKALPSVFKPDFVSDGLLAEAFSDSASVITKLGLAKTLDVLLLARQTVEYSTNTSLENVLTANMSLELLAASTITHSDNRTWSFNATGAGFKPSDARQLAEERLMKQITNSSLSIISTP